jgi:hypothetical protein
MYEPQSYKIKNTTAALVAEAVFSQKDNILKSVIK